MCPLDFSSRVCRLLICAVIVIGSAPDTSRAAEPEPSFNRDIRPILSANCFAGQGFDAKQSKADLRLDVTEGALAEHDGRVAIKPKDLAGSEVWRRLTSDDPDVVMPPPPPRSRSSRSENQSRGETTSRPNWLLAH